MTENILFQSYHSKDATKLKKSIDTHIYPKWLRKQKDLLFQICDELLKNAFKSNYKFLLLWEAVHKYISNEMPKMKGEEVNEWLRQIFYVGENILLEKNLKKIPDLKKIQKELRLLITLENEASRSKKKLDIESKIYRNSKFAPLVRIKKLAKEHKINAQFNLQDTGEQIIITVSNNCPILEEDVERIQKARKVFSQYYNEGRPEYFFVENIDTSGGGHGLGYALMDSILLQMSLDPEKSLYLVPTGTTMVLLVLPVKAPSLKAVPQKK